VGAFSLFRSDPDGATEGGVLRLFEDRGFRAPQRFILGDRVCLLWRKQLDGPANFVSSDDGRHLMAVGTPIYRRLGYRQGLVRLHKDLVEGCLDRDELRGAYCILFWDGAETTVMSDPANMYHVFALEDGSHLSSSQLAVVRSAGRSVEIDGLVLMEQLITGFITPPTTPYRGVVLVDQVMQRAVRWPGIQFRAPQLAPDPEPWTGNAAECLSLQIETLREHVATMRCLAEDAGVSIGLSGGYDSRLVLALLLDRKVPCDAHTWSSGAHGPEARIATQLARTAGIELREVGVRIWEKLTPEELGSITRDVIGYWDGRSNNTQGSFNEVHSRRARVAALGRARLGLSGHGGELYRNREHLPPWQFSLRDWLRFFVINPVGVAALRDARSKYELEEHLLGKYERLLGSWTAGRIDRHQARRWYARVWLPFAAGPKLSAENQLSFSLIVFAEEKVLRQALRCTSVIGLDGRFEATMIKSLSPSLASVQSNYGHPLDRSSLNAVATATALALIPHRVRLGASLAKQRAARLSTRNRRFWPSDANTARGAGAQLGDIGLPVNWGRLLVNRVFRDRAQYLAKVIDSVTKRQW